MNRKRGETYKQLLQRATIALASTQHALQDTRAMLQLNKLINPRTNNMYAEEAQFMFTSLAIIEKELRGTDNPALPIVRQTLEALGYNIAEQYENKCLKDDAYNA